MRRWPLRWKLAFYAAALAVVATIAGAATTWTIILLSDGEMRNLSRIQWDIFLGMLGAIATVLLAFYRLPLPWYRGTAFDLPTLYNVGLLASVLSGMIFLALYAWRLAKEGRLGFWRWLSLFLGVAGTYRQNDSVDVVYEAVGGRRVVAAGLPLRPD